MRHPIGTPVFIIDNDKKAHRGFITVAEIPDKLGYCLVELNYHPDIRTVAMQHSGVYRDLTMIHSINELVSI